MALAWEMLELARLIYNNNNGGAETHANKLADCHLYIGDILAEQVGGFLRVARGGHPPASQAQRNQANTTASRMRDGLISNTRRTPLTEDVRSAKKKTWELEPCPHTRAGGCAPGLPVVQQAGLAQQLCVYRDRAGIG